MLSLLLTLAALSESAVVTLEGTLWRSTPVVPAAISPTESVAVSSEVQCAGVASRRASTEAYCFADGLCDLYDVRMPAVVMKSRCKTISNSNYSSGCPSPFAVVDELADFGCLLLINDVRTWDWARDTCRDLGSDLLATTSPSQTERLSAYCRRNLSPDGSWWVGIYDNVWLNGRPGESQEWDIGQPDGGNERCGVVNANRKMEDYSCIRSYHAFCQTW